MIKFVEGGTRMEKLIRHLTGGREQDCLPC